MDVVLYVLYVLFFFFFKQKTAYEILTCDWSSDVCSSDLLLNAALEKKGFLISDNGAFDNLVGLVGEVA